MTVIGAQRKAKSAQTADIVIPSRFRGPFASGNGGYSCGVLAEHLSGCVEVTLKAPLPLNKPLRVTVTETEALLSDGRNELAYAREGDIEAEVPEAPTLAAATKAARRYDGFRSHLLPECFVCGPKRSAPDGMRIFAGAHESGRFVAAPWTPDASLASQGRTIRREIIWAALDCPSYFGLMKPDLVALLGRMTARIIGRLWLDDTAIVTGWAIRTEGRKHVAGSALFSVSGELLAHAEAIWVELKAGHSAIAVDMSAPP